MEQAGVSARAKCFVLWWPGTELNRRRQPFQAYSPSYPRFVQQLNFAEWPQFCDHSVTSADVRLRVGSEITSNEERIKCKSGRGRSRFKAVPILSTIVLGMSTTTGLADLLFGRTRGAVLALLYGRADQTFYTRQIAREVDASVGAVQRELENLTKVGLVVRTSLGSQVFYQANQDAPVFSEIRALVNKTVGVFGMLRSALHHYRSELQWHLCMAR